MKEVATASELTSAIATSRRSGKVVVVDFHATWCGPCHAIAKPLEALAARYAASAVFLKVDVDRHQDIAQEYRVSAMPTIVFLVKGQEVDRVRGADMRAIENALGRHAQPGAGTAAGAGGSTVPFSGEGRRLGDSKPVDGGDGGSDGSGGEQRNSYGPALTAVALLATLAYLIVSRGMSAEKGR